MSSVKSNKSSNNIQKRVTRSQSASNSPSTATFNTNLANEQNIIAQTYSINKTPEQNNNIPLQTPTTESEITSVITNTMPVIDKDIVMANTEIFEISSSSPPKLISPVTTPHVTLQDSIHANNKGKSVDRSSYNTNHTTQNDFTMLYTMPQNDHQQTLNNASINNNFDDANKIISLSDMEDIDITDDTNAYFSFALLNDFHFNSSYELKTSIRRYFLNNNSYIGIKGIQNYYGIKIIRIALNDEAYRNSIHNVKLNGLNVKFYNYEEKYIDQIVLPLLEEKYNKTIKIVDIPNHIDNSLVIETISQNIGPISNAVELKPYRPRTNNNTQRTAPNNKTKTPLFKQLKIEFESYNAINKIINEQI
ncbi:hypothetical protein C1645_736948 [Glomus cerebriforme]|uniref:Uncharacterized protein n=1 Tax=Glomus cerebriforme TaxID=658196 RepID=A0A397T005_9GLOM|nr:hypothetical protein C1645_736948 [Glomus cerebriforme]